MTRLFHLITVLMLLVPTVAAQQAPTPKPSDQPHEGAVGTDMSITVVVDVPARRALAAPAGPLTVNPTFDPPVPPIATASRSGNVVTITTTSPHGLAFGSAITIGGVADSTFNGSFAITGVSPSSFTYTQTGNTATSSGGNITITGSSTAAEQTVIQQAINDWQNVILDSGITPGNYPIIFRFTAFAVGSNFLALTNTFVDGSGNLLSANISFNTNFTFYEGLADPPAGSKTDLLTVARHEIGHALGWNGSVRVASLSNVLGSTIRSVLGAVRNSNVITITTTSPHGLSPGQGITISGVADTSFNGDMTVATVPNPNMFTAALGCILKGQNQPNASSGRGTVTLNIFSDTRLNIPVITGSGAHTDDSWRPNDLMTPCLGPGVRRNISLYPAASLSARAFDYTVPMQYVDAFSVDQVENGNATNGPWKTLENACSFSPAGIQLLLGNETFHVAVPFTLCASGNPHVIDSARGGAIVNQ